MNKRSSIRSVRSFWALILGLLFLTGCAGGRGYPLSYSAEDITAVKICRISEDAYADLPQDASEYLPDHVEIYSLSPEEIADLVEQLDSIPCAQYWNDPVNQIRGDYAIMIQYRNGTTEVLSYTGCGLFRDRSGTYNWYYFEESVFRALVHRYIGNTAA